MTAHKELSATELKAAARIEPARPIQGIAPSGADGYIPRRRGGIIPVPFIRPIQYAKARDRMLTEFGLDEYVGQVVAELAFRPAPHVSSAAPLKPLLDLFSARYPAMLSEVVARMEPPIQTLNKVSRLGAPFFDIPESKKARLVPAFAHLDRVGAKEAFAGMAITMNVRLQPEPLSKVRNFQAVNDEGELVPFTFDKEARRMDMGVLGTSFVVRPRGVFNPPFGNLKKQVLDTAINNVYGDMPLCHHDPHTRGGLRPFGKYLVATDVKHMERFTSVCVRARARIIGGQYGEIADAFGTLPYAVPSLTRKTSWWMYPNRDAGFVEQFGSGDSAVSPSQKEIMFIVIQEFAERYLRVPRNASFTWTAQGGDPRLTIHMFGDDMVSSGERAVVDAFVEFLGNYFAVEPEDPPRFLGFYIKPDGTVELGVSSYILKTWLAERPPRPPFRPNPCLGWLQKRQVYARLGNPAIVGKVFPFEDALLAELAEGWGAITREAAAEYARNASAAPSDYSVIDKDYLLSEQELLATGRYEGFMPAETAPMIKQLLDPRWAASLRF